MVLKPQSMAEKVMIIVWKWGVGANEKVLVEGLDKWDIKAGDSLVGSLIRMDVRKVEDWRHVAGVVADHKGKEVLLLLHNSHPNFLNEEARYAILKEADRVNISIQSVLFSGGKEPIYGAHCIWGILGYDGDFPSWWTQDGPDPDFNIDQHTINTKYFNFIWDFYWFGRRRRVLELSEEFRIYTLGYFADQNMESAQAFLEQNTGLKDKLSCFANTKAVGPHCGDYNMEPYRLYLSAKVEELEKNAKEEVAKPYRDAFNRLEKAQEMTKHLLNTTVAGESAAQAFNQLYNELINLFLSLPEDTL